MANYQWWAPNPITGSGGTNSFGNTTASTTLGLSTYTAAGDNNLKATLALARLLVEQGADPTAMLTVSPTVLQDLSQAV